MAGVQLYQTEEDELPLIEAAISDGCWLVPDLQYKSPHVESLRTVEEFLAVRKEERHFFILHQSFLRLPLSLRSFEKAGEKVFYVSPTEGGPFLEFLCGGLFKDEPTGRSLIRPGFLEYRTGYWDHAITRREASPPELVDSFKKLAKMLRSNSTRIKPGKSAFWLGRVAKERLGAGAQLVGLENWTPPLTLKV
jgi:hypothetical protein